MSKISDHLQGKL